MSTPALVWIVIGLVTTTAIAAVLVGLVRHAMLLGRTLSRFSEEVGTVAGQITSETDRASSRMANLQVPGPGSRA